MKDFWYSCADWWRRLAGLTRKELLQLFRDLPLVLFLIYSFSLGVYVTGSGISTQLRRAKVFAHDDDRSFASRDLISRFHRPYFEMRGELDHATRGVQLLDRGQALVVVDIPHRFHESLAEGRTVAIQLQVDTTNSPQGLSAASYASRIVAEFSQETVRRRLGNRSGSGAALPGVRSDHRVWYNPGQKDNWFESVAHILRMITLFAILLPAAALVREKERGTVEQLLVAPLTPFQILFSKVLAMTLVIVAATAFSLFVIAQPAFGVPFRGSAVLFFSLTALFAFTTAGIGLFAATLATNQAQVGLMTLLVLAPMLLLSGITTPLEAMPTWVRYLMAFSPLRYFIEITHGILFKAAGLRVLWFQVLVMLLFGSAIFSIGMWRFRRQFT